jgi:hypothetical protein
MTQGTGQAEAKEHPDGPGGLPKVPPPVSLRRTAIALAMVYGVDLFVIGTGFLALSIALVGLPIHLLGSLIALLRQRRSLAATRLLRAGLYLALGVMASLTGRLQTTLAHRHSAQIIAACRQYRSERGAYPERLEDLVPGYLKAVPSVNLRLVMGTSFHYSRGGAAASPMLWYADVPGASRQVYWFETDRWSHLD